MTTVHERLHGSSRRSLLDSRGLPGWLERAFRNGCISDEHILGIAVWLIAGSAFLLVAMLLHGLAIGAMIAPVLYLVPVVIVVARRNCRVQRVVLALPALVDALARSLRSGASFAQALAEAASTVPNELSGELQLIFEATARGQTISDALAEWSRRVPVVETRSVAAALALASGNERGAMHALDGVAHSLRDRAALSSEVRALASQATASMRAMVLLPVGFLAIDLAASQRSVSYLFGTGLGRWCLGGGVVLNAAGALWMRQLVTKQSGT